MVLLFVKNFANVLMKAGNTHQILLIFLRYGLFSNKLAFSSLKPHILALEFDYFAISQ